MAGQSATEVASRIMIFLIWILVLFYREFSMEAVRLPHGIQSIGRKICLRALILQSRRVRAIHRCPMPPGPISARSELTILVHPSFRLHGNISNTAQLLRVERWAV